ncbi:MAG: hypothetical protein II666_12755 [Butyrivibrio sp.]|nr:hypothetical protein [Butyrivibrio sp.]
MKRKAKWIGMILCLMFFASIALASGSSGTDDLKNVALPGETSEKTDKTDAEDEASESDNSTGKSSSIPTIEEALLIDSNGVRITAKEYATDSIWGDGIKLLIENGTDKDLTIGCDALIVNDYMISDLFVSEVAAGKSANETMYISSSELKAAGIDSVGKVEIYFHAYDSGMDYLFRNEYTEIQTSEYANMDTTPNDAGMELYNADGIKIVGKTVDENSFWGTAILLYIENNSGKNVGVSVEDMSINGFMMNPLFSTTVYDSKKAIDDITVFSSDLENNGIEKIEEVELKFHIFDADSYSYIKDTEPITFSAK